MDYHIIISPDERERIEEAGFNYNQLQLALIVMKDCSNSAYEAARNKMLTRQATREDRELIRKYTEAQKILDPYLKWIKEGGLDNNC